MKKKTRNILISILLIFISYGFVIYKIISFDELKNLSISINKYSFSDLLVLIIVFTMMFLNWGIETFKWKVLIDRVQYFSFINAFKAVFSGITIGIFTPNRIGEIGGRTMFLDKGKRTYGALATGTGSFAQFITTIATGIFGFVMFLFLFPDKIRINPVFNYTSAYALLIFVIILIWSYFNIKKLKSILLKLSFFKTRNNQLEYLSEIKSRSLIKILLLSLARYIVFITQFFLLLRFFDIHLTLPEGYISISLIYLFATLIPTTTLAELGIRGSLAIFFIGLFSVNILDVVFSTITLWLINLAIPFIIGSVFFLKKNIRISN